MKGGKEINTLAQTERDRLAHAHLCMDVLDALGHTNADAYTNTHTHTRTYTHRRTHTHTDDNGFYWIRAL